MTAHILVTTLSLHFRSNQENVYWYLFTFLKLTSSETGLQRGGRSCTAFVHILPPGDWSWWGTKTISAQTLSEESFLAWSQCHGCRSSDSENLVPLPMPLKPLVISCWLQRYQPQNKLLCLKTETWLLCFAMLSLSSNKTTFNHRQRYLWAL